MEWPQQKASVTLATHLLHEPMTHDEIAHVDVQWVWPNGREVPGVIAIARPSYGDDGWNCLATIEGLPTAGPGPVAGEDAL